MTTPVKIFTLYTLVDITHTGVVRGFVPNCPPYPDWAGQLVKSKTTWDRSRNQQRNWETVVQLLNLRAQPIILDYPKKINNCSTLDFEFGNSCVGQNCVVWSADFEFASPEMFECNGNLFCYLEKDFDLIPIITHLTERVFIDPECFCAFGPKKNIYFREKFLSFE